MEVQIYKIFYYKTNYVKNAEFLLTIQYFCKMKLFRKNNTCEVVPFIFKQARNTRGSESYKSQIRKNAKRLQEFEQSRGIKLMSNSLNTEMCNDLYDFFATQNLLENTITSIMSKIFSSFRLMRKHGYEVSPDIDTYKLKKETVTTVSLSSDEIIKIYNLKTKSSVIRDLFVVGCLTGMRYSDLSTLTTKNIIGNSIVKKTKKTGVHVEVPIHPIIREILDKYNGFPPYKDTQQNFNDVVKTLCKRAGITDKVYIERTRAGKPERFSTPKYKLVSSHTARRSFATNAYLAGIPTARIMLITGHTTESAFFKYIRISKSENAKILAEHPFFK